jgi:hypothetical protein
VSFDCQHKAKKKKKNPYLFLVTLKDHSLYLFFLDKYALFHKSVVVNFSTSSKNPNDIRFIRNAHLSSAVTDMPKCAEFNKDFFLCNKINEN